MHRLRRSVPISVSEPGVRVKPLPNRHRRKQPSLFNKACSEFTIPRHDAVVRRFVSAGSRALSWQRFCSMAGSASYSSLHPGLALDSIDRCGSTFSNVTISHAERCVQPLRNRGPGSAMTDRKFAFAARRRSWPQKVGSRWASAGNAADPGTGLGTVCFWT